jgi:prepilin-type N-terminal cleavage/methylation domain-containing protein
MLEPMMAIRHQAAGFTIIELMVVVAIAALLAVAAAPSFSEFLSKRRVDGVMSELVTDMHFARSESVSRNENVSITFGTDCYVIHRTLVPSNSATVAICTRTTRTVTPAVAEIKTVQLDVGWPLTIDPGALTFVEFEPVRGTAINSSGSSTAVVNVRSTTGIAWLLRAVLTTMGRVETCSPSGAGQMPGYSASCS